MSFVATYSYNRTAGINFDSVSHKAAEAEKKLSEAYLALHSFKAGLDAMHEIPDYLKPLYRQTLRTLDKLNPAQQEVTQLAGLTSRVLHRWVGNMSWGPANARVAARFKEKKKIKNKDGEERTVYVYSERQIALRNAEKARKIEHLKSSFGKLRSKVKKDLRSEDPETKLTALAVALIDNTYERVGNDNSVEERGHFGVTGWQKGHLSFGKGGVTISYTGKSGVKHKKRVTDDTVKKALRDAYEAVEGDDSCLFEWEGGKVSADKVNAYLETFDVTAKDLRGFHANRIMGEKLREAREAGGELPSEKKERQKILKAEFKTALEETAGEVGHEAATLRLQYLVPNLESTYLDNGKIDSP